MHLASRLLLLLLGLAACTAPPPPFVCAPASSPLQHEADFIEVPLNADITSRHFYIFQPADELPEDKPLVLFFNGGPGATSMFLAIGHTGKTTIDPDVMSEVRRVGPNTTSFSPYANLLWVDARNAGFSYDVWTGSGPPPLPDPVDPGVGWYAQDAMFDARGFLAVLLGVFDRYPTLACRPVVLAGESWGGGRATIMLSMLLGSRADLGPTLTAGYAAHFERLLPGTSGLPDPATVARQFGAQVLIQPLVAGAAQFEETADRHSTRPAPTEPLRGPSLETVDVGAIMTNPALLEQFTGTRVQDIALLQPAARTNALYRAGLRPSPLDDVLGVLPASDAYFAAFTPAFDVRVPDLADRFLANLRWVDTLITDADHDERIDSGAIPPSLERFPVVTSAVVRGEGDERQIDVRYADGQARAIRFPRYRQADHGVTFNQPADFLRDVVRFLAW